MNIHYFRSRNSVMKKCGKILPRIGLIKDSYVTVEFKTDGSSSHKGFRLIYEGVNREYMVSMVTYVVMVWEQSKSSKQFFRSAHGLGRIFQKGLLTYEFIFYIIYIF